MGNYPDKALAVLRSVSLRIERHLRGRTHHNSVELPVITPPLTRDISEKICDAAAKMADKLKADFIFVYTKTGQMVPLLSGCPPDCPIFAFTPLESTRRRLNLQWGVIPFCLCFTGDIENNLS
ncbi:Pyruvate kinase [Parasponia andersonii]|uniref:Pyruvate kinase n=1 Tax=Parasponia andersonii TaxID=3476 RepID=A0A2P5C057_PARAD|nr:Pyruvate kinase [Parasponia andersonii]